MAKGTKGYFPSQVVSDAEKASYDYGLKVARAIEHDWVGTSGSTMNKLNSIRNDFHNLRLYARGEQSIQKYKDELSINGDLSYLNLDWKPVPIIPKFVDIVVNGIAERTYDIKAYSQDPYGVAKRTAYMESVLKDMATQDIGDFAQQAFGINIYENNKETLPESEEELSIHMQLNYKQNVELAEEQAINTLLTGNDYELITKRFFYDLTVLGIGAVKHNFTEAEGVTVDYVDPANLVWSYTESPYFDDIYYCGEVKNIPINELKKEFSHLTNEDLLEISQQASVKDINQSYTSYSDELDNNIVQVLYFNYKTYMNDVYKVKQTATGATKVIQKDDSFDPPQGDERFKKLSKSIEVLYEGALVLGTDKLLKWNLAKNMIRPKSDYTKVKMNYAIVAPRM